MSDTLVGGAAPASSFLTFVSCIAFMPALLALLAATGVHLATRDVRLIAFVIADLAILVLHFIAVLPEIQ